MICLFHPNLIEFSPIHLLAVPSRVLWPAVNSNHAQKNILSEKCILLTVAILINRTNSNQQSQNTFYQVHAVLGLNLNFVKLPTSTNTPSNCYHPDYTILSSSEISVIAINITSLRCLVSRQATMTSATLRQVEMKTNAPADAIVDFRQQTGSGKLNSDGIFERTTFKSDIALRSCMYFLMKTKDSDMSMFCFSFIFH